MQYLTVKVYEKVKNVSFEKADYEGMMYLKPFNKKTNPAGVKDGSVVTISHVEKIKLPQTGDSWVLTFKEFEPKFPLNKTNIKKLVDLFGEKHRDIVGKQVKLIVVLANNPKGGGEVPSIRIKNKNWEYGDDEGEEIPDRDDDTTQPDEPTDADVDEEKARKVKERRSR